MPKPNTKLAQVQKQQQFLQNPPEVSCFIMCLVMVNQLRLLERAFQGGEIPESAFNSKAKALLSQLTPAVALTERFDIVMPVIGTGQFSTPFWRWFNWWEDYFGSLSATEMTEIERLGREMQATVNEYRPAGHWISHRDTTAFALITTN
jgi:hypothetical protein